MSFNYNPFKHIEITYEPYGNYKLYCSSCGAEWGDFADDTPLGYLFMLMGRHVKTSHDRAPKDFEGWSRL